MTLSTSNTANQSVERPERVSFIFDELQLYPKEELIDLLIETANELNALKREVKRND